MSPVEISSATVHLARTEKSEGTMQPLGATVKDTSGLSAA